MSERMIQAQKQVGSLHPPLFAELTSTSGRNVVLASPEDAFPAKELTGSWFCEVVAPGGHRAEGRLDFEHADNLYDRLVELFEAADDLERLWFDPLYSRAKTAREIKDGKEIIVKLWSASGKRVDDEAWDLSPLVGAPSVLRLNFHSGAGRRLRSEGGFLETSVEGGPSIFSRLRPQDYLQYGSVDIRGESRLSPTVVTTPGIEGAFWGFLRHGHKGAAELTARRLLEDLASEIGRDDPAPTIAAAHAVINFRSLRDHAVETSKRLADHAQNSIDAAVMRWIIEFVVQGTSKSLVTTELKALIDRILSERIVYSETLRLFYERLDVAVVQAEFAGFGSANFAGAVEEIRKLAHSSYWDSDQVVYRGRSPFQPDPSDLAAPEATGRIGVKKKFRTRPSRRWVVLDEQNPSRWRYKRTRRAKRHQISRRLKRA